LRSVLLSKKKLLLNNPKECTMARFSFFIF